MENKRVIAYRSEHVKGIAYNLRNIINTAVWDEWDRLRRKKNMSKSQTERAKIGNECSNLIRALNKSICICPRCNKTDREMTYNTSLDAWYCKICVQEYRVFYLNEEAIYGVLTEDSDFYKTFL